MLYIFLFSTDFCCVKAIQWEKSFQQKVNHWILHEKKELILIDKY